MLSRDRKHERCIGKIGSEFNKQPESNSIVWEGAAVSFWQETSAMESKWCECYWITGASLEMVLLRAQLPNVKDYNSAGSCGIPCWKYAFLSRSGGERKSRTKTHRRTHRHTEKHCQETTSFCFFKDVLKYWETKRKLGKCSCARQLHFISLLM